MTEYEEQELAKLEEQRKNRRINWRTWKKTKTKRGIIANEFYKKWSKITWWRYTKNKKS